ncbi:hypothetical protein RhiirB3_454868 [Rhizophagus irregularis]|nr:hypothetical protein RhiirB3_454868 [Rhizophagus irregularis]
MNLGLSDFKEIDSSLDLHKKLIKAAELHENTMEKEYKKRWIRNRLKELDYDAIPFQPNLEADDDDLIDADRDLNINQPIDKSHDVQNRPIAESSGTQPNVDKSLLDFNLNTVTPLIVDITQPQHIIQQENISMDLTKSLKQKKKSNKNLVKNVITGHILTDDDTSRVRDILVYDILVSWTSEDILKELLKIELTRGERKLLGFFERWVDMRAALENQNRNRTLRSQKTKKTQQNSKNFKKKLEETTSKKPDEQKNKKDKSRSKLKDKVLVEILDLLRKLV